MVTITPEYVIAVKTKVNDKVNDKVTKIDLYTWKNMPEELRIRAIRQGIVVPHEASPISYDFVPIGNKAGDVQKFMEQLAREDGVDLNTTVKNAFGKV